MDTLNQTKSENFTFSFLNESSILYIENDTSKEEISQTLNNLFSQAHIVDSYTKAHNVFEENENHIDIILLTLDLPNEDSFKLLNHIREKNQEIPIIIITDFNNTEKLLKVIKYKISDYLVKPIQINTTLKIIDNILKETLNEKKVLQQKYELEIYKNILNEENLISETDTSGNIIYINDSFCEASGYKKEELLGANHNIMRHPDVSSKLYEELWTTILDKRIWKGKIKNKAKDGSAFYMKCTIFPIANTNGKIEKYISSRFLITEQEEEKHKLKKYILNQKSAQVKHEKELQQQFDEALHFAKMQKDEQVAKFINGLNEQVKSLKVKHSDDKGRILSLENKLKASTDKYEDMTNTYMVKVKELRTTTKASLDEYTKMKKKYEIIFEKFGKSQETIKTLQEYIDEYRKKIDDLNDVINAYEKEHGQLSTT